MTVMVATAAAAFTVLPAPPPAYASGDAPPPTDLGWTAAPGPSLGDPPTVERRLHRACDPSMRMLAEIPAPDHLGPDLPTEPLPLVVADSRGEITVALFAGDHHAFMCQVDRTDAEAWEVIGGSGQVVPQDRSAPISALGQHHSTVRRGVLTGIYGTVGPDVDAITVQLADGTLVRAATHNGYYVAWWPTAIRAQGVVAHRRGQPVAEIPPPDITSGSHGP